jgi:2-keto-4-pentenoate hydratase/2-oxohepta-3-ene-1,7-dioic acid hydratase in catechol pathway
MRLASFHHEGRGSYGIVEGESIIDLGADGSPHPTLRAAIAGDGLRNLPPGLVAGLPRRQLTDVELDCPVPDAEKILCVGRNYRGHAAEVGIKVPDFPHVFIRTATSLVAHGRSLICPRLSTQYDFEGELAIVIGKQGRHIPTDRAMEHVFGYTCFNDGSVRDVQFGHSLAAGKNFFRSGSIGPWVVTADEVSDPEELIISTYLNGERMQYAPLSELIFGLPQLISYFSTFTELQPGDIIATGTPEGVGMAREPQLWMKPGDRIEIEISSIGKLSNDVVADED